MLGRRSIARLALMSLCAIAAGLALPAAARAQSIHPFSPHTHDAGPTPAATQITTSIILNVTDLRGLEDYVRSTVTPGDPNFHQFLSVREFRDRFAPSTRQISQLVRYLKSYGIRVDKIYPDHLDFTITGSAAAINAAFATQEHDYDRGNERFHRPDSEPTLPGTLGQLVLALPGLSNQPGSFRPMLLRLGHGPYARITPPAAQWPKNGTATGIPQDYTVGDVANFYNVNPLYDAGITGEGQTVGIMTLANFNKKDAYSYWRDIGLQVAPNRITKVMVDGGTPVAVGVGDDETSVDVEQSGGLAPEADIRVYIAPNTNQGFIDLFYNAVSDNIADAVSISWGEPEELYFAALNGGVSYTSQLQAIHEALLEGAAQGQSFFAAAGDAGAYDINDSQLAAPPNYSTQLTVDAPADDPAITAAGGTTIATTIPGFQVNSEVYCPAIDVPLQRVWGWHYLLTNWGSCLGLTLYGSPTGVFPVGGGGGVSSFWPIPAYQSSTEGIQRTEPGQSLYYYPDYPSLAHAQLLIRLKADYPGRNLPDLSLNADPETGYVIVDCTDYPAPTYPGCAETGYGGTSFVAPELNGITALIDQDSGGRVGLLNPTLYALQNELGYGSRSPFNAVTAGNNWFYYGTPGYNDGAGIGTINAARLAVIYKFLSGTDTQGGDGGGGFRHGNR